ncbi:hypothetical protein DUNSADRAFT_10900 [Dunaliella salina]|uniref:Encoded protein n=1 Tax=Dunaliella salina TaxID=3046 RepID=A0ABQ7H4Q1_DUNSA|nr:hypothetical protein DUNSADRAFT_10900 [Dunaliella salina]|eukprot:KAF5841837.1 hypothetical protein DUNSADRAFT_10900 [Dunaliella salina]
MAKQQNNPLDMLSLVFPGAASAFVVFPSAATSCATSAVKLTAGGIGNVWNLNTTLARNTLSTISKLPGFPTASSSPAKFTTSTGKAAKQLTQRRSPLALASHARTVQRPAKEHKKVQASMQKGTAAFAVIPDHPMSLASLRPHVARPPARVPQVASDDWVQVNIGLQSSML